MIDTETAKNLELVGNMMRKKTNHSLFGSVNFNFMILCRSYTLLYSTLNHTHTAMAGRLLRANILAPITGSTFDPCILFTCWPHVTPGQFNLPLMLGWMP